MLIILLWLLPPATSIPATIPTYKYYSKLSDITVSLHPNLTTFMQFLSHLNIATLGTISAKPWCFINISKEMWECEILVCINDSLRKVPLFSLLNSLAICNSILFSFIRLSEVILLFLSFYSIRILNFDLNFV